jgi:hypothetical protein
MYKLAIEDTVEVNVKFTLKTGKVNKTFTAVLTATRLEQEDIAARMTEAEFKYKEFLLAEGIITGWSGQRLVLDADGEPADFNPEALGLFLSTQGVAKICFEAYQRECGAKEKN